HALRLERIRELHDQDAVLRDQSHQGDQPHLRVDVDGGEVQEAEHQRPGDRERHRAHQHDERVAEAPELRREHKVDEDHGETEGHRERRPLEPDLPRLSGVVHAHARAGHGRRGVLVHAPPSRVPSSRPTLARSRPRSATWSRSITTRASGRSIFKSVSTYKNLPLCQPAPNTAPTVCSICSGGTSLARISSTSYWPGDGS